jgi:glucose-1-phosphate adenylyltransferase
MGVYVFSWKKLKQYLIADELPIPLAKRLRRKHHPHMLAAGVRMSAYAYRATGRDSARSLACGMPTWTFSPRESGLNMYDPDYRITGAAFRARQFIAAAPRSPPPWQRL